MDQTLTKSYPKKEGRAREHEQKPTWTDILPTPFARRYTQVIMTDNIVPSNTGASVVPTSPSGGVASPKTVKKMEKEIMQEAKHEEKELKNATKDMDRTKKAERKAQKVCYPTCASCFRVPLGLLTEAACVIYIGESVD